MPVLEEQKRNVENDSKGYTIGIKKTKKKTTKQNKENLLIRFLQVSTVVFGLALWEIGVRMDLINSFLFSSPLAIWNVIFTRIQSGQLFLDISVTGLETILGFAIGSLIGSAIGLSLWYSKFVAKFSNPFILALGSIPVIALAPLIIIWFGTGIFSKVVLAAISCIVVALLQTYEGAQEVDNDLINLMSSFGAKKRQIFSKIVIPSSMTWVVSAFKLNIGFALIGAVIGEYISSDKGLGHMILRGSNNFSMDVVLAGLITLMLIALALNVFVGFLEDRLLRWKQVSKS